VNLGSTFDLGRSYKWMQGRAQPRSARVYEDWAALLGTSSPIAQLQSCTVDEFLDLVCDRPKVSRGALAARAGIAVGAQSKPTELNSTDPLLGRHLVGAYACYSHAWSPYFHDKVIRGSLVIEPAPDGAPGLAAIYCETVAFGPMQLRGPVSIVSRAVHIDLSEPLDESILRERLQATDRPRASPLAVQAV